MRLRLGLLIPAACLLALPGPAAARCTAPGDPDCVDLQADFRGTVDFFATGAALTVNDDEDDRPDRALDEATVVVPGRRIPAKARLLKAYLYFGGSLFADGDEVEAPDMQVELQVPGATTFTPVTGDEVYRSGPIPGFPEVILYSVRADITALMQDAQASLPGTYRLRGFAADIFNGAQEHTAATAAFSIILIFEEPRLPPRSIVLFDGMQEVLGSTVALDLSGFIVSEQPSGSVTIFALEGDCNPGPESCARGDNLAGLERARVIGADGARTLVLQDDLNPPNDLFNRTINTVDPPLSNVTGTDIDTFDITEVLRAGDESVRVEVTTPLPARGQAGELVGLGYVVVGIDVFAPELRVDSRVEISTDRGSVLDAYFPGDPLRVKYALSNTGNLPGTQVDLTADMPANVRAFEVLEAPEGAQLAVETTGGAFGRGRVTVSDVAVRHGEVSDLVLLMETDCPLPEGGALVVGAEVGAAREGGVPFSMSTTVALAARDICGPRYALYGGGGCRDLGGPGAGGGWLWCGLLFLWGARRAGPRARRLGAALALGALALGGLGCSPDTEATLGPDRPAPDPLGFPCPGREGMVIVPSIRGQAPFCVDQYEASLASGELGHADQPEGGDGSTTAVAASVRFAHPAAGVSWHQARAACANAGKRLCTAQEWQVTCRGDQELTYPYGETYQPGTCNGFAASRGGVVEAGAMIEAVPREDGGFDAAGCVSVHGAYDLSGNVWEWNADAFLGGARRGLAGGSFRANAAGLRCVTEDSHARPGEVSDAYGFRCCADFTPGG
jgi:hypothetical protein